MATAVMDLISDDHRGLPGERMVRVEHLNLAPQTPGIMRSPRIAVLTALRSWSR